MRRMFRNIRGLFSQIGESGGRFVLWIRPVTLLLMIVSQLVCMGLLLVSFIYYGGYNAMFDKLSAMKFPFGMGNVKAYYSGIFLIVTISSSVICLAANYICYYITESLMKKLILSGCFLFTVICAALSFGILVAKEGSFLIKGFSAQTAENLVYVFGWLGVAGVLAMFVLLMIKSPKGLLHVLMSLVAGFLFFPLLTLLIENIIGTIIALVILFLAKFIWKRPYRYYNKAKSMVTKNQSLGNTLDGRQISAKTPKLYYYGKVEFWRGKNDGTYANAYDYIFAKRALKKAGAICRAEDFESGRVVIYHNGQRVQNIIGCMTPRF